jgi:acylphosphatase
LIRVHVRVHGQVQGVYYRASAQQEAERLGLHGWVRNRQDGSVEVVAEGEADPVEAFLAWCRRGPERAQVRDLEIERLEPIGAEEGFHVRPTA